MISNLNAPNDRPNDVYPFNVEPTVYDLPTPAPMHRNEYDLRTTEQKQISDLEVKVARLQSEMGMMSIAMLELVSRIEVMEYKR
jgi:hypothetical protein